MVKRINDVNPVFIKNDEKEKKYDVHNIGYYTEYAIKRLISLQINEQIELNGTKITRVQ